MQSQTNPMAADALTETLKKRKQINITVIGCRTGRQIKIPVWFVFEGNALWLLPVNGSHTQWYRNLKANRAITIEAGGKRRGLRARLLKSTPAVRKVIQRFRVKYTAGANQTLVHHPRCRGPTTPSRASHLKTSLRSQIL